MKYDDMTRDQLIAALESRDEYVESGDYAADMHALEHDDSDWGDLQRVRLGLAPSEYDSFDSKGQPLRPRVNDAGEPYWM